MDHKISTPVDRDGLKHLRAGDRVFLSGVVYTMRDAAHKLLCDVLKSGEEPPYELAGSAVYYVGPTPEKPGQAIGSAGPTTAGRMDAYSPMLISRGQLVMIGKGVRSKAVVDAIVENGAVYLGAIGGAGALMAASVVSSEIVCWEHLGCEAVRRLVVKDFPLTVIIDSQGGNLYKLGPEQYLKSLK